MTNIKVLCRVVRCFALFTLIIAALCPLPAHAQTNILNFNLGSGTKTGLAAVTTGAATNDIWNLVPAASTVASTYTLYGTSTDVPVVTWGLTTNVVWANSNSTTVTVLVTNLTSVSHNGVDDVMFDSYLNSNYYLVMDDYNEDLMDYVNITADPTVAFQDLPTNTYTLYIYGLGSGYYDYQGYQVKIGTNAASSWKWTSPPETLDTNWTEGVQYVKFTNLVVKTGETLSIKFAVGDSYTYLVNGIQLVSVDPPVPAVTFTPGNGTAVPTNVTLSVTGHGSATIRYTTDGSTPNGSSTVYSSPISVTTPSTIKAFATETGYTPGAVSSASYVWPTAPAPDVTPDTGTFSNSISVSITSSLSGASYQYSYDGSSWSNYTGSLVIDGTTALYARTIKDNYQNSSPVVRWYTFVAASVSISPNGGRFTNAVDVSLICNTTNAVLQYSIDAGSTWITWTNTTSLDGLPEGAAYLYLRASKAGYATAFGASDYFTFVTGSPVYSQPTGDYTNSLTVTISSVTTGATIEYSTNADDWLTYTNSLTYSNTTHLYARVLKTGYLSSGHAVYSARDGFSSQQGLNGWFYFYSTVAEGSTNSYLPLFDSDYGVWRRTNDLNCLVGADVQRPGPTNDSVRAFLAPMAGNITIVCPLWNYSGNEDADGVKIRILQNDTVLTNWVEINNELTVTYVTLTATVATGDLLYFQLNGRDDSTDDLTYILPEIDYGDFRVYSFYQADTDGDGLSDALEALLGTNVGNTDSDGDGVSDYMEWLLGRNPLVAGEVPDAANQVRLVTFTPLK